MKEVIIRFDFLHGPLWKNQINDAGESVTGIEIIDNDAAIQTLNDKAEEIYSSFYHFDEGDEACTFDEKGFEKAKPQLLSLIETMIKRLEDISDGTYTIRDEESERLRQKAS